MVSHEKRTMDNSMGNSTSAVSSVVGSVNNSGVGNTMGNGMSNGVGNSAQAWAIFKPAPTSRHHTSQRQSHQSFLPASFTSCSYLM